jgi:hypothetical protein
MKPTGRTLSIAAALSCAAVFLIPLTVFSDGLTDFFTKFNPTDPCDWSGVYFGLNVGGTWNHFDIGKQRTDVDILEQFNDLTNKGEGGSESGETGFPISFHAPGHDETDGLTIGGMQTGFNLQFGHFVVGAEGSFIGNGTTASKGFHDFRTNMFSFDEQQQLPPTQNLCPGAWLRHAGTGLLAVASAIVGTGSFFTEPAEWHLPMLSSHRCKAPIPRFLDSSETVAARTPQRQLREMCVA